MCVYWDWDYSLLPLSSEIRTDSMSEVAFWIELLHRLADDTERLFDLEDRETAAFNAKLVDPGYELRAGDWSNTGRCYVPYNTHTLPIAFYVEIPHEFSAS